MFAIYIPLYGVLFFFNFFRFVKSKIVTYMSNCLEPFFDIKLSLCIPSCIILPVLLHYFWCLRHHFVISPRNPFVTVIISLVALVLATSGVIFEIIYCQIQSPIAVVIDAFIRGCMVLIYVIFYVDY